jgi:hypothetical protein
MCFWSICGNRMKLESQEIFSEMPLPLRQSDYISCITIFLAVPRSIVFSFHIICSSLRIRTEHDYLVVP